MSKIACLKMHSFFNDHISYVGFTLILKFVGFHQKPTTFICKCFPCLKPSLFPWVVLGVPKGQVWNTGNRQTPAAAKRRKSSGALTSRGRSRPAIRFLRATEVNDSLMAIEGG